MHLSGFRVRIYARAKVCYLSYVCIFATGILCAHFDCIRRPSMGRGRDLKPRSRRQATEDERQKRAQSKEAKKAQLMAEERQKNSKAVRHTVESWFATSRTNLSGGSCSRSAIEVEHNDDMMESIAAEATEGDRAKPVLR